MKIAVVGCLHGELDIVYQQIENFEKSKNIIIDLVLICGDVQTIRNENDFKCLAVPPKYRRLGDFHQYYFGDKIIPKLTLFIGGNHEASNYLQTLPYGGWVAPNMYYLGYCSVIRFGPLRIGGISGIFKQHDAKLGHFECLPYDQGTMRSIYHMREMEIYKLLQLPRTDNYKNQLLDIFMSHDWPINIHQCATERNLNNLLNRKPFFRQEIEQCRLGNPLLQPLVHHFKPKYWFAAHLHVGFNVTVTHSNSQEQVSSESNQSLPVIETQFQALDKVLPRRYFLHIEDIKIDQDNNVVNDSLKFEYDPEWLAVLKKTDHLWKGSREQINGINIFNCANEIEITQNDLDEIAKQFSDGDFSIPNNFQPCKPVLDRTNDSDASRKINYTNPQTTSFCSKLGIWDPNEMFIEQKADDVKNPDEIDLDSSNDEDDDLDKSSNNKRMKSDMFFIDTKGTL
ncbi:lariat debranching enzyme-like protein [Dermatophagoides farinae]|uniref:Lariat debranching enzyme-like protein n=1 Tax=Dermatophagoides farinae TaxID=6954 RepID=A0A9D4P4B8_DERFA|nr:lariat debranching enzyme-like [Dermatophagoides farinae]KAH7643966.1 lariat debranching enzyme-like protein [Dermatophagoides farinae]